VTELLGALGALALVAALIVFAMGLARLWVAESYSIAFVLVVFGLFALAQLLAEALNWLVAFNDGAIRAFWLALLILVGIVFVWKRGSIPPPRLPSETGPRVIYATLGSLFLLTFITGLVVAPNNWDSLTYHLPRAVQWLQNAGLEFFVTSNARQNVITPLPDVLLAQLLALDHAGHLLHLGQFLAGLSVVVAVAVLTRGFALRSALAKKEPQVALLVAASALIAGTTPMLLSQMSTTQADLVAGVPLAAAMISLIWALNRRPIASAIILGFSISLALSTKATSLILTAPIAMFVAVVLVRKYRLKAVGIATVSGALSALLLSGRHLIASAMTGPYTTETASDHFNQSFSPNTTLLNATRMTASSFQSPFTEVNSQIQGSARSFLALFGLDPDSPSATFGGSTFNLGAAWSEDHVSALFHALLFVLCLAVFLIARQWRRVPWLGWWIVVVAAQFVLMATLIRWQPWINRFTFLVFVLAAPVIAWVLLMASAWLRAGVLVFLTVFAFAWVLLQPLRGLAGTSWLPNDLLTRFSVPAYESPLAYDRYEQLFMHHPPTAATYQQAVDYAASLNPAKLLLVTGGDDWEYPIWVRMQETSRAPIAHYPRALEADFLSDRAIEASEVIEGAVILCINSCSSSGYDVTQDLFPETINIFSTTGPATRSVEIGPTLIVGRVTPP